MMIFGSGSIVSQLTQRFATRAGSNARRKEGRGRFIGSAPSMHASPRAPGREEEWLPGKDSNLD
jgi:hypothetical protein